MIKFLLPSIECEMRELHDVQTIIEAANDAAAANDYTSAEALLRKALVLQEAGLDPIHPDLASTVNNLGIVCEINNKPADAEACFRRAFTIATHALPPDHPLVETSRQNLRDFCQARGKPFELPTSTPASPERAQRVEEARPEGAQRVEEARPEGAQRVEEARPEGAQRVEEARPEGAQRVEAARPERAQRVEESRPERAQRVEGVAAALTTRPEVSVQPRQRSERVAVSRPVPRARQRLTRTLVMGVVGPGVMLIVVLAARPWVGSTEGHESSPAIAADSSPAAPAAPAESATAEPTPVATDTTPTVEDVAAPESDHVIEPAPSVQPVVVRAKLCAALEDWHCDPPDRPIPAGQLFFYTQVRSATATTVHHRWYQGDRLLHSVDLSVEASRTGYRSFSRYTMKDGNAGNWKVELRADDGTLLQEERFSVQ
jgi:Protein of unknown function (DUF2914)/Tetratricopeptide repeat